MAGTGTPYPNDFIYVLITSVTTRPAMFCPCEVIFTNWVPTGRQTSGRHEAFVHHVVQYCLICSQITNLTYESLHWMVIYGIHLISHLSHKHLLNSTRDMTKSKWGCVLSAFPKLTFPIISMCPWTKANHSPDCVLQITDWLQPSFIPRIPRKSPYRFFFS